MLSLLLQVILNVIRNLLNSKYNYMKLLELLESIIKRDDYEGQVLYNPSVDQLKSYLKESGRFQEYEDDNHLRFIYLIKEKELFTRHAMHATHDDIIKLLIKRKFIKHKNEVLHGYLSKNSYYIFNSSNLSPTQKKADIQTAEKIIKSRYSGFKRDPSLIN